MTNEEAIAIEHEITRMLVATVKEEHKERVFTAHKMAIEALEKQIPKKPNVKKWVALDDVVYTYHCPHCDVDYNKYYIGSHHCKFCGQAISWEGEE